MNTEQKIEAEAKEMFPNSNANVMLNTPQELRKMRRAYIAGRSKGLERQKELEEALEQCMSRIDPKSKDTWDLKALYVAKQLLNK